MGIVIRQSIAATVISYAGAVIGYINLLYLFPKILSPEQVGLLRAVQDSALLLAPFAQFGLAQSVFRFYPQMVKEKLAEAPFINFILLLSSVGFGLFLIVFYLFEQPILNYFSDNARELISYAPVVLWLTFIVMITTIMEAYSRSLLKIVFPNFLREVFIRLMLGVLVIAYFEELITFNQFIVAIVFSYLLSLAALVLYLISQKSFAISFRFTRLPRRQLLQLARYSFFSFAGSAAMIIVGKIDSLMVSGLAGLKANAVYTTAFYMAAIIEFPKRAMSQIAMPIIARAFDKGDYADIKTIYRKTSINQLIIGALLLTGIYINLDNIFALIPKREVYEAGKYVVLIVGLGKLIDMAFGPSSEIIVLSRYYKFNILLILLLAAGVIISNNILIPAYGINGAAMGSALALTLFNTVKYVFIYYTFKMQPFNRASFAVVGITITCIAINALIPPLPSLLIDILIRSGAVTVAFATAVYYSKASLEGNAVARGVMRRVFGK